MIRRVAWTCVLALIVLATRAIAYALHPSPLAQAFEGKLGGPGLPVVTVVAAAVSLALATTIVWLAALGVRERRLLERRTLADEPRLHLAVLVRRAILLFVLSCAAFALVESYVHWRAGLGWHGIRCLWGPVHADAVPIAGALSLVAAAIAAAVEHVLAWMRRTIASLADAPLVVVASAPIALRSEEAPRVARVAVAPARGPPPLVW